MIEKDEHDLWAEKMEKRLQIMEKGKKYLAIAQIIAVCFLCYSWINYFLNN